MVCGEHHHSSALTTHGDGLWGTSPLISSDHAEPSQIVPANSDQARLINPSPRIFTLLPTAASERCVPSEFYLPHHLPAPNEYTGTMGASTARGAPPARGSDSRLFEEQTYPAKLESLPGQQAGVGSEDGMALHLKVQPMGCISTALRRQNHCGRSVLSVPHGASML